MVCFFVNDSLLQNIHQRIALPVELKKEKRRKGQRKIAALTLAMTEVSELATAGKAQLRLSSFQSAVSLTVAREPCTGNWVLEPNPVSSNRQKTIIASIVCKIE